jgi:NADH-quinone oxidoreductase subunit H
MRATTAVAALLFGTAGCGGAEVTVQLPALRSAIRDARPTRLHPGETLTVEGRGEPFAVGATTQVILPGLHGSKGGPVILPARAVAPDRVLATYDSAIFRYTGSTVVEVEQRLPDGTTRRFASDPRAPFDFELAPRDVATAAILAERAFPSLPGWLIGVLTLLLVAAIVSLPVPVLAGLIVTWERKVSAAMQSRIGPNRVGPRGWLQWLADGVKLLLKEDVIPTAADARLFRAAPYLAFLGLFLTFIVLPFSRTLIVADLDVGVLFLLSVTSLIVVGILVGGWASNSKWSLLGGMRSAAQIISYELPASMALLTLVATTGSLRTQAIVAAQGAAPWDWFLFRTPFTLVAFVIWFIAALAEGNRTPFDLPEAESELVAGFFTEYSGFRFSLYPLVEWVNLAVIGAVGTVLFLGGWRVPFVPPEMMATSWLWDLLGFFVFALKDVAMIFLIIWIRWTLPRFRVDQMMSLCWRYAVPWSMACLLGTLGWVWLVPAGVDRVARLALFALVGVGGGAWFALRVRANARAYRDLVLNDQLGRGRGRGRP